MSHKVASVKDYEKLAPLKLKDYVVNVLGYKLCKSASTVDCPFQVQPPKDLSHIYEEIQYTGGTHDDDNE